MAVGEKSNVLENRIHSVNGYSLLPRLVDYDRERHIDIASANSLIEEHVDNGLSNGYLDQAIISRGLPVYSFGVNGKTYLDRLELGRLFHQRKSEKEGLTIERYFSKEGEDPFSSVGEYETKPIKITDVEGNIIFEMQDATFPQSWSDNARSIVAQKYFFKPDKKEWQEKLKEKIGNEYENSPIHLVARVSNFFTDEGWKMGYFKTEKDREIFRDELKYLQINQNFAFNSPVQFNAGIFNEYKIEGGNGVNFHRNPETGEVVRLKGGCYVKPQCHACFIKGPIDNLESILNQLDEEGQIFSSGSGIGQEISVLRAEGEKLSGGGKASGPMSFFKIYDDGAATIKSGGKSRRAARMTTMRQYHPDIIEFIRAKVNEDRKALTLMKAGYEPGMDGEAYRTVTFQNTNLSVRLDDYFFEQIKDDGDIDLINVNDKKIAGRQNARRMLQEIAFGSWRVGDPGVQYESLIQEMHTSKNSGRINSSNPCSEYMFLDDTSCNLASTNLLKFSDELGNFNLERFNKANRLISIALDIANDAASYPVKSIASISPEFRTIGLGYANLGALLMRKGLAYDSDEGRAFASGVTALMTGVAYETSAELAEKLEPFVHYEFNKNPMMDVILKHRGNLDDVVWEHVPENLKWAAYESWNNAGVEGQKHGFRNAQATVLAPTGTISYLMDCDTTGVEPATGLVINKDLAGGGTIKILNNEIPNALFNLTYTNNEIMDISKFLWDNNSLIGAPHLSPDHYKIFDTAFGDLNGDGSIAFEGHVKMLGAVQPFISGAISKTNNLPEHATVKDIYDAYILGHDIGLKALAVFRNNSKPVSALNFGGRSYVELKRGEKEELPNRRKAFESEVEINGTPLHIITSDYEDGRPGQIVLLSYNAGSELKALLETQGIMASKALKRGESLEDVLSAWKNQAFNPSGLVNGDPLIKMALSPLDYVAKLLSIEYLGKIDLVDNKDALKTHRLHGAENGAFRTYRMQQIDDWDADDVLKNPELGGFVVAKEGEIFPENGRKERIRGATCQSCGRMMVQKKAGCWECGCGNSLGGCSG